LKHWKLNAALNDPDTINDFGTIYTIYAEARDEYVATAQEANATPVVIDLETDPDFPDDPPALPTSNSPAPSAFDTCIQQLGLARAATTSTGEAIKQLVFATEQYNTYTEELRKRYNLNRKDIWPLKQQQNMERGEVNGCPTTTTSGIDWKIITMLGTRVENCDGSATVYVKASIFGIGFVDVSCVLRNPGDPCKTGTRYGITVGIASVWLYFGINFSGGKPRGIYFKPQVCYDFVVYSDCADTTLDLNW